MGWYLAPFQRLGDGSTPPKLTHREKEQIWLFQASKSRMGITCRPPFAKVLHYSRDILPENLKLQEINANIMGVYVKFRIFVKKLFNNKRTIRNNAFHFCLNEGQKGKKSKVIYSLYLLSLLTSR